MDYQESLRRLLSLTDLERMVGRPASRPRGDLARMHRLLSLLGDPHKEVPAVHITGTKGKGSVAAMVASILRQAGYAPGLYTSPHLHSFRERIALEGEPLSEEEFARAVERVWPAVEGVGRDGSYGRVTTFETLTAMAFSVFRDRGCRVQVVEVGLGGTLDATNVLERPLVCVFTPISRDHTEVLGDTVEKIARDKAGIIKEGATVVSSPQPPEARRVIEEVAGGRGAEVVWVEGEYAWERGPWDLAGQQVLLRSPEGEYRSWLPLLGRHQGENALCALAVAEALRRRGWAVSREAIERGLEGVHWPGRLEVLSPRPLLVVDGAHNPASLRRLREAVREYFSFRRLVLLLGFSSGHDLEGSLREALALSPDRVVLTRSRHPRSVPPESLLPPLMDAGGQGEVVPEVPAALDRALKEAGKEGLVLVTGSLFLVAEVREVVKGIPPEVYPEFQRSILPTKVV